MSWEEAVLGIAELHKQIFERIGDSDKFLLYLAKYPSTLSCFVEVYAVMKRKKMLQPIEDLTMQEKQELWSEAKRIVPSSENQNKEYLIMVAKAIHSFGSYISK